MVRWVRFNRELTVQKWVTALTCRPSWCRLAEVENRTEGCVCIWHRRQVDQRYEHSAEKSGTPPEEFVDIPDGRRPFSPSEEAAILPREFCFCLLRDS